MVDASAMIQGVFHLLQAVAQEPQGPHYIDRKSTRLNSSHANISYAVFCLKKKTSYIATRSHSYSSTYTASCNRAPQTRTCSSCSHKYTAMRITTICTVLAPSMRTIPPTSR